MKKLAIAMMLGIAAMSASAQVIGMDDRNMDDLKEKAPSPAEWKKIHRMTEYCTRIPADHVPDPYYGGAEGFEYVLDILEDACAGLLTSLTQDS